MSAGTAVGPLVMVTPPPQAPADEASTTDAPAASAIVHCVLKDVAKGPPRRHWCARHSQTPAEARVPSGSGRSVALSLGSWDSRWADCDRVRLALGLHDEPARLRRDARLPGLCLDLAEAAAAVRLDGTGAGGRRAGCARVRAHRRWPRRLRLRARRSRPRGGGHLTRRLRRRTVPSPSPDDAARPVPGARVPARAAGGVSRSWSATSGTSSWWPCTYSSTSACRR